MTDPETERRIRTEQRRRADAEWWIRYADLTAGLMALEKELRAAHPVRFTGHEAADRIADLLAHHGGR